MHTKSNASHSSTAPTEDLVLEQLPNGEHAWLRPDRPHRAILPSRYWITDKGRAAIHANENAS